MAAKLVPATPTVIAWAIRESGFPVSALATMMSVPESEIEGWMKGERPEMSKLQALAKHVRRPFSAFLLPHPPETPTPSVKFRSSSTANRRALYPEERRRIREAHRLQQMLAWLSQELGLPSPGVPFASLRDNPERIGTAIRDRLAVPLEMQFSMSSATRALHLWRTAVERLGVTVLALPMGEESCRGFSIWDDAAPLIAINTAWMPEARVFTLIHEFVHLSLRSNSACAEDPVERAGSGDRTERWCDRVAAAVLIPAKSLTSFLSEKHEDRKTAVGLSTVNQIASQFRVSRRAAALRLIEHQKASWSLFRSMPPHGEHLRSGGGGLGRTRAEIRRQEYGERTLALFRQGLGKDIVGAAEVVDYLGISPETLRNLPSQLTGRGDE